MAVTRIKNNQITDASGANTQLGVNAAVKLQNYTVTAAKLANSLVYGSDLTVSGNLTVNGTTTTVDTINTLIKDPILTLADGQTAGTPVVDIGLLGLRGNQNSSFIGWLESSNTFGAILSNTTASNTTVNVTSYANFVASTITAQGNLSVVGNIVGSANFTGNVTAGNLLTPGVMSATGNVTGGNILTAGLMSATGTATLGNVATGGTVSATGNVTGGNVLTAGLISATGGITSADTVQGLTVSATGNVIGGNVSTAGLITASGNITGGNLLTAGLISSTGTITSATTITGGNLATAGTVSATGNVTGGNILTAGLISATSTITSAANITGGNILTGGLVSATGNVNGGNLISAALVQGVTVSASGNVIGGNVTTAGLISATGNVTGGNVNTAGAVSSTGNVVAGNVLTSGLISATSTITSAANITGGNLLTGGLVSSTGNVIGGNLLTAGIMSAGGNATAGNVTTAGLVSAAGNVYGGQVVSNTITNPSGSITISSPGNIILAPTGNIVLSNDYINNLADPVQAYDAATKQYVDDAVSSGITIHTPVLVEANVALNGTYAQGGTTLTVTDTVAGNTVVFSTSPGLATNDQLWFTNSFNGVLGNVPYFVVSTPNTSAAVLSTTYNGAPVANITSATGLTQAVRVNSGVGATLTNAGANATLVIDNVTMATSNRVLLYVQANAVQNGVYTVTNPGNATTAWQLTRSTDTDTYGPKSINELDVGDYFFVQSGDTGAGESYVMTAPDGPFIIGYANLTFTQFSDSQVYSANTAAGLSLIGTVFNAKVDNNTTAFDGGGNISVKAGANLTTPNIGAATGTSLSLTGTATAGNLATGGTVSATGNVIGGNVNTAGLVTATGNVIGGNVTTPGLISATGNITGGNILFGSGIVSGTGNVYASNFIGNISGNIDAAGANTEVQFNGPGDILTASPGFTFNTVGNVLTANGNINGANLFTGGTVSATGNINGGNLISVALVQGVTVSASGNVIGGNVTTAGLISATGTITSASNISGANFLTVGLISATGNVTGGNVLFGSGIVSGTGNIYAANLIVSNIESVTGNITGGNLLTGGLISATGSVTGVSFVGNVVATTVSATANVTGGNITTAGLITATGNIYGGNLILAGAALDTTAGRLTVNSTSADADFAINADTVANVFYVDAGNGTAGFGSSQTYVNAIVSMNATTSMVLPAGTLAQRPSNASSYTGMIRFNTTNNGLEIFDNSQWTSVGGTTFTVIADEQFNGDGSTVQFTLGTSQTTNSCIVSINGVVQIPGSAYSVAGTAPTCYLTFTEAPAAGDLIDVREITTTTTVTAISNNSGNAQITGDSSSAAMTVLGNLIPTANTTYTLGNATNYWKSLYVGGNTIYLGGLQLQSAAGNVFSITTDGTTPATLGNVTISSTGNVTSGNVLITGIVSATGNITGSNLSVGTGTVTVGNIVNSNANGVGNIGSASTYFNTVFAKATSAQYADLAEKYVADAEYAPGTVLSFGGDKEVTKSAKDSDRAVAGVVSTNPSYIMNGTLEAEHVATIALTGRVPTSVTGTVAKGDLMVSNGDGTARAEADPKAGAIIGKALENFEGNTGVIEVVIGRF